jgi:hypothetical protein
MPEGDAFAGIRLSEQVGPASIEQRLFSGQPLSPTAKEPKPKTQETGKPGNREVGQEGKRETSQEGMKEASKEPKLRFNLADSPTRKDSFLFTEPEFEALEDLKLELRRKHQVKVTKNDLARCALHLLVEDYETNRERSFLGRKFIGKSVKKLA